MLPIGAPGDMETARTYFESAEKSGVDYKDMEFLRMFNEMPGDFKENREKAAAYMQVFAGNEEAVAEGAKTLFGLKVMPSKSDVRIVFGIDGNKGISVFSKEKGSTYHFDVTKDGIKPAVKIDGTIFRAQLKPDHKLTMKDIELMNEVIKENKN